MRRWFLPVLIAAAVLPAASPVAAAALGERNKAKLSVAFAARPPAAADLGEISGSRLSALADGETRSADGKLRKHSYTLTSCHLREMVELWSPSGQFLGGVENFIALSDVDRFEDAGASDPHAVTLRMRRGADWMRARYDAAGGLAEMEPRRDGAIHLARPEGKAQVIALLNASAQACG